VKQITFYFDVISPYAFLAFEKLPEALQGISHQVSYRPVLFGAILQHHGQLGPAEIAPKRVWTYQQIQWLAKEQGTALRMPASHPFNPLQLLRLAVACGQGGACNRYTAETLFRHVWQANLGDAGAQDAASTPRLQELIAWLKPARGIDDAAVKAELKSNTEAALAHGVFGVPSYALDGQMFWGLDALPMLRQYCLGDTWFAGQAWQGAGQLPVGIQRTR
jgi:2-hydroxychromene-2-carboxylate isomerase